MYGAVTRLQAQPGDDRAAAALVQQLDDNLQGEMRMWGRLDREFLGLLTPLQVLRLRRVHAQWCTCCQTAQRSVAMLLDDRGKLLVVPSRSVQDSCMHRW
jgi:hypothetical protein